MSSLSDNKDSEEREPLSEKQMATIVAMAPSEKAKDEIKMDYEPPSKIYSVLFWSWALAFWVSMFIGALHGLVMKGPVELYRKRELWEDEGILKWWGWLILAIILLFFAYSEGYRGFQLAWSPMLVKRAYHFSSVSSPVFNWTKITCVDRLTDFILAPILSAGHICGTRRRLILSWSITIMVILLIVGVSYMDGTEELCMWKSFIDIGVVIGLGWGLVFILVWWVKIGILNKWPDWVRNEYPNYLSVKLPENFLIKSDLPNMIKTDDSLKEIIEDPPNEKS
jgi:hypothetical protein